MKIRLIAVLILAFIIRPNAQTQTHEDSTGITTAALNYIEGWYEGNGERMEKALHPELAKRMVSTDVKSGKSRLSQMSALTLINSTRAGGGKNTSKENQLKDVTILDIYQNAACAKVVASGWIDYLQLAKWNGEWKIVNVLWELKPEGK